GTIVSDNTFHSNANAVGWDNSRATKNNTRVYDFDAPAEVTATFSSGDTVTINGTTYYKEGATFKLTLTTTSNDDWHKITGIKGASQNSDGTFNYAIGTTLEFEGFPKIGSLAFDDTTNTYTINNKADLQALADFVEAGNTCAGLNFKLGGNIEGVNFHIGTADSKFAGTLDGDDKTITVAYDDGGALFNYVDGATFSKLTVDGTINTSERFAAGLISLSYGNTTINDCTSSVTINSSINGAGNHGGFVGSVDGGKLTISNGTFDGKFIGQKTSHWGGFVGWNGGDTEISGGLFAPKGFSLTTNNSANFACNGGKITDSYFRDNIGLKPVQGEQVFALNLPAGVTAELVSGDAVTVGDKTYYKKDATFKLTLNITSNDEFAYITGIKGATKNSDGTFDYTIGTAVELDCYAQIGSLGFDTTDNSYTIATKEQLTEFRDYVNAGHNCAGLTFKLTDSLDLDGVNWTPIGNYVNDFKGTFDGDEHTISNLKITGNETYQGLFGFNGKGGTIKNVNLINANISGSWYVGGIAGNNWGTIDNCAVEGTISGDRDVGGIAGINNKGIVKNSSAFMTVSCNIYVGAIVGNNSNGNVSGNEYASNVGDKTGAIKWLTLPTGITATPDNAAYKVTVDGTDYYKPDSTVKLTISIANNDDFEKITGFKGLTANDDGTFNYTIGGAALEFDGYAKIGSLAFDGTTNTYTINNATDLRALADFVEAGNTCAGYKFTLGDNISGVDFHIGTMNSKFAGTFDGDNKKITVSYETDDVLCALF
ncbi:MAG: hypothetical protein IJP68_11490, partial [Selenomonadaceae bacterium]|nr:hypothetical protein [Selenomonadaceae bacterium]